MITHRAIFKRSNFGSGRPDFWSGRSDFRSDLGSNLGPESPQLSLRGLNWGLGG